MLDQFNDALRRLPADDRGATAIEYGLIVALIASALISAFALVGSSNEDSWAGTATKASEAMQPQ
jgi:pilus assembly protein Flp/PilA